MTTMIQDPANANDFIVPADVEAAAAAAEAAKAKESATPKVTTKTVEVKDDTTTTTEENGEGEELTAEQKAAAREAFKRRKAEREAEGAARTIADLQAQVKALAESKDPATKQAVKEAPKRPDPAKYDLGRWDPKYEEDLSAWLDAREEHILELATETARTATSEITAEAAESRELNNLTAKGDEVAARGVDKYADFAEVVQDALEAMPPHKEALKELVQLPNAEDVFYHLAQHPDELEKITALTPMGQALEFGKISQRLANKAKATQRTTTSKPSPTTPRGDSGKFVSTSDDRYDKLLKRTQVW